VTFQVAFLGKALAAGQAAVRSLPGVNTSVGFEVAQLREAATAERTAERPLARVSLQMGFQFARMGKALAALAATQEVSGSGVRVRVRMGGGADVMRVCRLILGFDAHPRSTGSAQS